MKTLTLHAGPHQVTLLSLGGITQSWTYNGVPLILGHAVATDAIDDPAYAGAIIGRTAGRVRSPARFGADTREMSANEGLVHLHGGPGGLSRQYWDAEQVSDQTARFKLTSKDGADGYPGTVQFTVTVTLSADGVTYDMQATTDARTWISMAQHNYYCLGGSGVDQLKLTLPATHHLALDTLGIATGQTLRLTNDLRLAETPLKSLNLDHAYVLNGDTITLSGPAGRLSLQTDQPCAQVYTGSGLTAPFQPGGGVAIEPQGYPNATNCPSFPLTWVTPETPYHQRLNLKFAPT